jgi:hypothetical protein
MLSRKNPRSRKKNNLIKRYEAEQQIKSNLIVSTNLPNETIANIANVTLSFVEDLRKTLTQK